MITAAAVIMAGTGNQELFNYIEKLMQTTYINASYGNYVACYSAMGFLFLGGGQYTFPASPSDNRTHLEALRHMWILALESRCLVTRDIDSNAIIQLPMKVTCRNLSAGACRRYNDVCFDQDNITISLSTPCILPNMSSICGLKSETSKYWGIDFERRFEKQHQSMVFSRYPELLAIAQAKRRKLVENSQQVKSQLFWDNLNEYFAVPSANYNLSVEHFLRNKFKSLIWDSKSEEFSAFCEAELSEDPWMTYYFMRYCFSEFRMRLLGLERHQQ
ncbi:hypothetical protein BC829DRAFT_378188 [Chytridium lagenaria]|nr:hypothetical protein BC829DRAFT_378188 [Chytridium lagenaria]